MNDAHKRLCEIGAKFLKRPESGNGHGCHFTVIEAACYGENPDVFGVRHGLRGHDVGTILLEAKTSRSDFLIDRKKPHRTDPATGMGKWRYYICPTDLIKVTDLPEKWGLIYVNERGHCKIVAGAMAVPKERYVSEWRGKEQPAQYFRNSTKLIESFEAHAFHERNLANEMNLLTMALARLNDAEAILYMQREFNNKLSKLQTLEHKHTQLERDHSLIQRRLEWYKENNVSIVKQNLMSDPGYTPYYGSDRCLFGMPRTKYKNGQFHCMCGWVSEIDAEFMAEYKKKWNKAA